ncbi:MAG: histidinol-phosphate transaminase [Nakamurella sp.]
MTPQLRAALEALPAYAPGRTVPGAIKLASNEMPFPPLDVVVAAITAAAAGVNRYPDNGSQALTAKLAGRFGVDAAQIAVGCGSVALCQQLVEATCVPGDEVLYAWRSFEAYPIVTHVVGATSVHVPLSDEALDLAALGDAITDRTRLIFVCSPNNPTGTVVHRDALDAFLARVPDRILVVLDEAYREFVDDPAAVDGIDYARGRSNVLVLRTLSKAYGLAGLRVGFAVGDPVVMTTLRKIGIPFAVNALAQAAAIASLDAEDELLARCRQIMAERSRVRDALLGAGFAVPPTQANFVWLPLRDRATQFAAHCEAAQIIVRPFADPGNGGVRVSIGTTEQNDAFLAAARSFR